MNIWRAAHARGDAAIVAPSAHTSFQLVTPGRVAMALAVAAALLVGQFPTPAGIQALDDAVIAATAVFGFAPLVLGARPRRLWALLAVACALSVAGGLLREHSARVGPLTLHDALNLAGMACLAAWILCLTCHVLGRQALSWAVIDTALLTLGFLYAALTLAPLVPPIGRAADPSWALYPIADIAVIGFSGQVMARAVRRRGIAHRVVFALACFLVIDVTFSAYALTAHTYPPTWVSAWYLPAHVALILAITHPAMRTIALTPSPRPGSDSRSLREGYVTAALLLVVASQVVAVVHAPAWVRTGAGVPPWDVARAAVLVVLILLLLARIVGANRTLARSEAVSTYRATHDSMTGLLNRSALFELLDARLVANRDTGHRTALLYIDCDDLKTVNDAWGHLAGDAVIRQIATNLLALTGPGELVARQSGDHFVVVSDVTDLAEVEALSERLRTSLAAPVTVAPNRVHEVTVGIGVAVAEPDRRIRAVDLLGEADLALNAAKAKGRGRCVWFDAHLRQHSLRRAVMSDALRDAVARDTLTVAFQPIHRGSHYARLAGWEALARWSHPQVGEVSPAEFIPLAEELGVIVPLGERILRKACQEFVWMCKQLGVDDVSLSVNVSAPQLTQSDFPDLVRCTLAETGLAPERLCLEVTESLLVEDDSPALRALQELREMGVGVGLDDFGTGYASIATLLRLPIDCAKIDRSLVERGSRSAEGVAQLQAVIDLLRSVGVGHVVAEGIETEQQAVTLARLGCPYVQGWLFGRPMPVETIVDNHRAAVGHAT